MKPGMKVFAKLFSKSGFFKKRKENKMLSRILKKTTCGECKICCGFDCNDTWEMPVMTEKTKNKLESLKPGTEFINNGSYYITKPCELSGDEIFYCPGLDKNSGCILGEDKPFDCKIWPFRVMNFNGSTVITVSSACNEIFKRPLNELVEFLDGGLADAIDEYSAENPEIIKDYDPSYQILKILD